MHYDVDIEEQRKREDYQWRLFDYTERVERSARLADLARLLRQTYDARNRQPVAPGAHRTLPESTLAMFEWVASAQCTDRCAQELLWFFGLASCPGLLDWMVAGTRDAPAPPSIERAALDAFVKGTLVPACDALVHGANDMKVEDFVRGMRFEYVASVGVAVPTVEARVAHEYAER